MSDPAAIRDAASLILLRRRGRSASVLMGQRGLSAAFMPSKFVFPGGALDPEDRALAASLSVAAGERRGIATEDDALHRALAVTAVRELREETGLALAEPREHEPVLQGHGILRTQPGLAELNLIFRAITPPGRPRRFDARFFLADASAVQGDPDDFASASGELSHLQWVDLADARRLALPFITEVVLAEVAAVARGEGRRTDRLPFFHQDAAGAHISLV